MKGTLSAGKGNIISLGTHMPKKINSQHTVAAIVPSLAPFADADAVEVVAMSPPQNWGIVQLLFRISINFSIEHYSKTRLRGFGLQPGEV